MGTDWGGFRPSVRRLPRFTSVLSSSSQSWGSGLPTLLPSPKASWVCGLRPHFDLTSCRFCRFCLTLPKLGFGACGSVLVWLFLWSAPLCRTRLDTAMGKAGLQVTPYFDACPHSWKLMWKFSTPQNRHFSCKMKTVNPTADIVSNNTSSFSHSLCCYLSNITLMLYNFVMVFAVENTIN